MFDDLLAQLEEPARNALRAAVTTRQLGSGDVLFWEGERGDAAYLVDSGHLIVERTTSDGDVVAFALVGPGELIGEQALISDEARNATARVVDDASLRVLSTSAFSTLRSQNPGFDELLIDILHDRLRSLSDLVMDARHRPVDERLRRTVGELHDSFGVEIPLSQDTVAALAGTTRQTANPILRAMQEAGIVELGRGRLRIVAPERL